MTQCKGLAAPSPEAARRSPANAVAAAVDMARAAVARAGLRPYRLFLVWTASTGNERGDADEVEVQRVEVLPVPKIDGLDGQARNLTSGGVLPDGTVRVSRISVAQFDFDTLVGHVLPEAFKTSGVEATFPRSYDFYYEMYEDGRTAPPLHCTYRGGVPYVPGRTKWRVASVPSRHPFEWVMTLERISEDADRYGKSQQSSNDVPANLPED